MADRIGNNMKPNCDCDCGCDRRVPRPGSLITLCRITVCSGFRVVHVALSRCHSFSPTSKCAVPKQPCQILSHLADCSNLIRKKPFPFQPPTRPSLSVQDEDDMALSDSRSHFSQVQYIVIDRGISTQTGCRSYCSRPRSSPRSTNIVGNLAYCITRPAACRRSRRPSC